MQILIICFFTLFFVISILGIIKRLLTICAKCTDSKIELYDDRQLATDLKDVYVGRLADTSVRSSVRYHKSLYKTDGKYEQYRNEVRNLILP